MKRVTLVITILLIAAVTLLSIGCGQGQQTAISSAAAQVRPLTLWVYDSGRIDILSQLGQDFEAQFGVPVNVTLVDLAEIRNQVVLASRGAEAADMVVIPHDNLGAFVTNDAALELELGDRASLFLESAISGFTYGGKLYGLPLAVENIGFFVNPSMVPQPPQTWEEMYTIGKALVDTGRADFIMGYPDATYNVFPVYSSFGGYIFGEDSQGIPNPSDLGLNNPGFVQGLEFLTRMVREGYVPEAIDWNGAHVLFESGRAPFVMTGPWAINRFVESRIPYEVHSFPNNGAPFLGVQGIVVNSSSSNALLAQTFLTEFLATEENMLRIFNAEPRPSAWKSIFETMGSPDVLGFNAAGVNAIPMPSIPEMGFVWDAWVNAAALAFSGELTPRAALDNAVRQISSQIEGQ